MAAPLPRLLDWFGWCCRSQVAGQFDAVTEVLSFDGILLSDSRVVALKPRKCVATQGGIKSVVCKSVCVEVDLLKFNGLCAGLRNAPAVVF